MGGPDATMEEEEEESGQWFGEKDRGKRCAGYLVQMWDPETQGHTEG